MTRRGAILAILAGAGAVVVTMLWWRHGASTVDAATSRAAAAAASAVPSASAIMSAAPGDRTVHGGVLTVIVRDPKGAPTNGVAYWVNLATAPTGPIQLAPDRGYALAEGTRKAEFRDGRFTIDVPYESWTWLRVVAPPALEAYARVRPFSGTATQLIQLDPRLRAVHVFLVARDLRTPVAGQDVRLMLTDAPPPAKPELGRDVRTDETGYALFDNLKPGAFLLLAPGTTASDPPPSTQRVILPASMPTMQIACSLVMPEEKHKVKLRVMSGADSSHRRVPPKLILKRREGGDELFSPSETLRGGIQDLELMLPAGIYELDVLPLGDLLVVKGDEFLRVPPEGSVHNVRLEENTLTSKVLLQGIHQNEYPVSVYPRPVGAIHQGDASLLFCGTFHWQRVSRVVKVPPYPCRVVVSGKGRFWLSRDVVKFTPGTTEVPVISASRVDVSWVTDDTRPAVVEYVSDGGIEVCQLAPRLAQVRGATKRALSASLVVPHGRLEVSASFQDAQSPAWTREVEVSAPLHLVEVVE